MSETSEAELLPGFLDGRSHPCPVCGDDLRDLRSDRCPECGRVLRLTVTEDRPVHAPFIVGLIALAVPLGGSGSAVVGLCYSRIVHASAWDLLLRPLVLHGVALALAVPALAIWLRSARLLRRQPPSRQRAWAATLIGFGICLLALW